MNESRKWPKVTYSDTFINHKFELLCWSKKLNGQGDSLELSN